MTLRSFKGADYLTLVGWWKAHWDTNAALMTREHLPDIGLVVEGASGAKQAMGFLYRTDSKIAWIELVTVNPELAPELRAKALDEVIVGLVKQAKDNGFKTVFTTTHHEGLISKFRKLDFVVGDRNMTQLIRSV